MSSRFPMGVPTR